MENRSSCFLTWTQIRFRCLPARRLVNNKNALVKEGLCCVAVVLIMNKHLITRSSQNDDKLQKIVQQVRLWALTFLWLRVKLVHPNHIIKENFRVPCLIWSLKTGKISDVIWNNSGYFCPIFGKLLVFQTRCHGLFN